MIFILFYFPFVIVMIFALVIDYVSINTTTTLAPSNRIIVQCFVSSAGLPSDLAVYKLTELSTKSFS